MLSLRKPGAGQLAAFVARSAARGFNYAPHLLERAGAPMHVPVDSVSVASTIVRVDGRRWFIDRHAEVVGHGDVDFQRACEALRNWVQFWQTWAVPAAPPAPIATGAVVGYSARVLGLWWSYRCQVVAVHDGGGDSTGDARPRRFALDYGTLAGHAERGEERFEVSIDAVGVVRYGLVAVSRPGRWFTWFGVPLVRRMQAKFRTDSAAAIRRFIANSMQ